MSLTNRQKDIVAGVTARLREIRDSNIDGVDALRAADVEIRTMLDSLGPAEFGQLGSVYEQILLLPAWNV